MSEGLWVCCSMVVVDTVIGLCRCFFFQAEDGIRDLVRSRGLGDVYKRQGWGQIRGPQIQMVGPERAIATSLAPTRYDKVVELSLIHI